MGSWVRVGEGWRSGQELSSGTYVEWDLIVIARMPDSWVIMECNDNNETYLKLPPIFIRAAQVFHIRTLHQMYDVLITSRAIRDHMWM